MTHWIDRFAVWLLKRRGCAVKQEADTGWIIIDGENSDSLKVRYGL